MPRRALGSALWQLVQIVAIVDGLTDEAAGATASSADTGAADRQ